MALDFPTAGVLDDFNRADGGPPASASWGSQWFASLLAGFEVASADGGDVVAGCVHRFVGHAGGGRECRGGVDVHAG